MEEKALEVQHEKREMMPTGRARTIAKELMAIVKDLKWAKNFGGQKDHLEFEAWQFIAAKEGATASTPEVKEILDKDGGFLGFEARAELLRDGEVLSEATHECTITEANWKNKPRYSLRGMAQTRAMGRVCRNRYAWIARMGGFAGTPSDEMGPEFRKPSKPKTTKGKDPKEEKKAEPEPTTEPEPEPKEPEKPETEGPEDKRGVRGVLLKQIQSKVADVKNIGQAELMIPGDITWEQEIALVNLLATCKEKITADEWHTKRDEILNKK